MVKRLEEGKKVAFTDHLIELRERLIRSLLLIGFLFLGMWAVSDSLVMPIASLMNHGKLIFIDPTEAFFVHVKVSFYASLSVAVPFLLHQAWEFVAPGLLKDERQTIFPFLIGSTIFFMVGVLFCYFAVLPLGLNFLLGYGGDIMEAMISASSLIGFCVTLMFVFGVVFQLPIIVVLLHKVGLVGSSQLVEFRPYLIVASFIISALITPPDVFTQVVLSIPLIALYEISIVVVKIIEKKEIAKGDYEKNSG